jgi:hypothetical protein
MAEKIQILLNPPSAAQEKAEAPTAAAAPVAPVVASTSPAPQAPNK